MKHSDTNEAIYHPESAVKKELLKKIKEISAGLVKGKVKTYPSMADFIMSIKK
jgi:hypothetical protein